MPEVLWGVCATVRAPTEDILRFAAYYLDAGAHRIWVHLDAPDADAETALNAHPKCRVIACDEGYWKRLCARRPDKVEVRQTQNATRAYLRAGEEVTWFLHADVDEFIVAQRSVADTLAAQPADTLTVRVRPMEALSTETDPSGVLAFKQFIPPGPRRQEIVQLLYPAHGRVLRGGFLSHVAGKVFARTGLPDPKIRIHNVFRGEEMNPGAVEASSLSLAHLHAPGWESWRRHLDYRLEKGAYRADLNAAQAGAGDVTLNQHLTQLRDTQGEAGLRSFFDEVCADSESLRERLTQNGLLALHDLGLDAKRHQFFPGSRQPASTV